jgi:transmembrane protein TMEM260 (protein O-mannosyltransferase)
LATTHTTELDYRPSYLAAGIATALVLVLYLLTLAPSTAMWDTSEYIAAAYIMGLPHPPGNPFFVLLGRFFTLLPIAPSIGARVNILAAICSAVSAGAWFLITERVLVSWLDHRWQRIVGGSIAALIGATAFTVWSQSVVNEKVYTVALAGVAIIAWLTVRWCDEPDGPKADRLLVLIAYLLGLGYANHMAGFLAAPAVGLAVLIRRPRTVLRYRLIAAALAAVLLGMTPFATQPVRAAYFPAINEGEPTGCRTEIGLKCTFSKQTWDAFKYNFNREQYGKPPVIERQAPFVDQVGMWWLYFKWQWIRDAYDQHSTMQAVVAALFLVLGLFGGWVHYKRDRQSFWFFGPLMFTMTLVLIYYLNFRYGYSQAPELGESVPREVRDRDYFYLWSFSAWSVWAALGLVFVWESVAALVGSEQVKLGKQTLDLPLKRSWLMASPLLGLALIPLFANWAHATRRSDTTTRDFAHDLLNSVEPYGVLVTVGDNDTFPLWYAQEVEGIRQDVVIANTSLLNTDWYTRQLIRAPIRAYDEAKGPAIYRGKTWVKPTTPPVRMDLDAADRIPLAVDLTEPQKFTAGKIEATITPRTLTRADIFVLTMIKDATGRSIYFSRTSGGYGQELGLGPYLLTQGLARKLLPDIPKASPDTVLVPGEGFVDLARSRDLWSQVFTAPKSIIAKNGWVDKPSVGIPALYVSTGLMLSDAVRNAGQPQLAAQMVATAERVAQATHLGDLFGPTQGTPAIPLEGDSRSAIPLAPAPAPATPVRPESATKK